MNMFAIVFEKRFGTPKDVILAVIAVGGRYLE